MAAKMAIKWQKLKVKKFEGKIYCGSDYMKQIWGGGEGRGGEGREGQRVKQHLHIISKTQHLKLNSWKVKQWGLVEKWGCLCLYQVEFSDFWKKI